MPLAESKLDGHGFPGSVSLRTKGPRVTYSVLFAANLEMLPEGIRQEVGRTMHQIAEAVSSVPEASPFWSSMKYSVLQIDIQGWRIGYKVDRFTFGPEALLSGNEARMRAASAASCKCGSTRRRLSSLSRPASTRMTRAAFSPIRMGPTSR